MVGDKVRAQWRPNAWYPGKASKGCAIGLHVVFDDGDEADLPVALIVVDTAPQKNTVKVGSRVLGFGPTAGSIPVQSPKSRTVSLTSSSTTVTPELSAWTTSGYGTIDDPSRLYRPRAGLTKLPKSPKNSEVCMRDKPARGRYISIFRQSFAHPQSSIYWPLNRIASVFLVRPLRWETHFLPLALGNFPPCEKIMQQNDLRGAVL